MKIGHSIQISGKSVTPLKAKRFLQNSNTIQIKKAPQISIDNLNTPPASIIACKTLADNQTFYLLKLSNSLSPPKWEQRSKLLPQYKGIITKYEKQYKKFISQIDPPKITLFSDTSSEGNQINSNQNSSQKRKLCIGNKPPLVVSPQESVTNLDVKEPNQKNDSSIEEAENYPVKHQRLNEDQNQNYIVKQTSIADSIANSSSKGINKLFEKLENKLMKQQDFILLKNSPISNPYQFIKTNEIEEIQKSPLRIEREQKPNENKRVQDLSPKLIKKFIQGDQIVVEEPFQNEYQQKSTQLLQQNVAHPYEQIQQVRSINSLNLIEKLKSQVSNFKQEQPTNILVVEEYANTSTMEQSLSNILVKQQEKKLRDIPITGTSDQSIISLLDQPIIEKKNSSLMNENKKEDQLIPQEIQSDLSTKHIQQLQQVSPKTNIISMEQETGKVKSKQNIQQVGQKFSLNFEQDKAKLNLQVLNDKDAFDNFLKSTFNFNTNKKIFAAEDKTKKQHQQNETQKQNTNKDTTSQKSPSYLLQQDQKADIAPESIEDELLEQYKKLESQQFGDCDIQQQQQIEEESFILKLEKSKNELKVTSSLIESSRNEIDQEPQQINEDNQINQEDKNSNLQQIDQQQSNNDINIHNNNSNSYNNDNCNNINIAHDNDNNNNMIQEEAEQKEQEQKPQIKQTSSEALPLKGDFIWGDKATLISACRPKENEIIMDIEWKPRSDGTIPEKTTMSSKFVRENDPDLLIDFYESKIKFTYCKVEKKKSQNSANASQTIKKEYQTPQQQNQ